MNKQELILRWQTAHGILLLKEIISCLTKGISLSSIQNLEKINERWDLRGAKLSEFQKERTFSVEDRYVSKKIGSLNLKNSVIENIDFSYCDLSYSLIEKCIIQNCLFEKTKAQQLTVYASAFDKCFFVKTDLSYSFMNENIGRSAGSFINCEFTGCNLKESSFCFPIIDNCLFKDSRLYATNFNGSRISNTKFVGLIDSPIFCGYPKRINKPLLNFFNKISERDYFNKMLNVDFSKAKLIGVSFINEIELNNCTFPLDSENYILVKDIHQTFNLVKDFIVTNWEGDCKRKAINLIEYIYLSNDRQNQKMDFIDKFLLVDNGKDQKFGELFFSLIVKYSN